MADVVIVGGGPAGSKTAAALAKDHEVIVLEEHGSIGEPVQCAGLITEKSIEMSGIRPESHEAYKERQYDKLAEGVRSVIDMDKVYEIIEKYNEE